MSDVDTGAARGLRFDPDLAARTIGFFEFLRHSKAELAGQPIELEGWQEFLIGAPFGWLPENGARRFRTAYLEVPRKS